MSRAADAALDRQVRPSGWRNPEPAPLYDLVVLGGGTAGLVAAMGAVGLGARVALVERGRLGGDCLNTGCVPSKALIRSARAVAEIRGASALGVMSADPRADFGLVMHRLRARRAQIAAHDAADRLRSAGVDVFFGDAAFADRRTVRVDQAGLRFRKAVIATGARPARLSIPGLDEARIHTSESIFSLSTLPRRLVVIGAGPIGCELGQAFARLGSAVTMLDLATRVLPREDADAAALVAHQLARDGVRCELGVRIDGIRAEGEPLTVTCSRGPQDGPLAVAGDVVLSAVGRTPNIDDLDLAAAGVDVGDGRLRLDDRLRTTNPRVYASGDVCGLAYFTHAADAMSRLVLRNALFFGRRSVSTLTIPRVTFTAPEVAHVGVDAAARGNLESITIPFADLDRAVVDDDTDGFLRLHHQRGRLRGCTIVSSRASDLIGEAIVAVRTGTSLAGLSETIHPYPTYGEAFRKAGDTYRRTQLTPSLGQWMRRYFRWSRAMSRG